MPGWSTAPSQRGTAAPGAGHARTPVDLATLRPAAAFAPARRELAPADLEFMLDCVADGLIVVDGRAHVLHANRPARELLGQVRDGARGCGALVFRDHATQRAFERALVGGGGAQAGVAPPVAANDDLADDPADDDTHAGPLTRRQFLVRDAGGRVVARAAVEPLQRRQLDGAPASAHLVSLHRQPASESVSAESLATLYGLTQSEARVAAASLAAHSVDDLAQRLGLSRNTVKTHLKRVFRKCEVSSFAQLAALVATGPRRR